MANLKAKKEKNRNVKIDHDPKETKGEFLRRLVKKYSGKNAELPKVF